MNQTEILIRLSIIDNEISKLRSHSTELQKHLSQTKLQLDQSDKKLQRQSQELQAAEERVKSILKQLENERVQYSNREKQITSMGGVKSAKHLGRENDRSSLAIDGLEKEFAGAKTALSEKETSYLQLSEQQSQFSEKFLLEEKENSIKLQSISSRLADLEKKRGVYSPDLSPEFIPHYDRLRQRYADPVTTYSDKACDACSTNVPLRIIQLVTSGAPQACPGCSRYLVESMALGAEDDAPADNLI